MSTHEKAPSTVELNSTERDALQVSNIDKWRAFQDARLAQLRQNDIDNGRLLDGTAHETFGQNLETDLDAYLERQGIVPNSPQYAAVRAQYRGASIDAISEADWLTRPKDSAGGMSARDLYVHQINSIYPSMEDTKADDPVPVVAASVTTPAGATPADPDTTKEHWFNRDLDLELRKRDLKVQRERWARIVAKRSGRAFGKRSPEHEEVYQEYETALRALGKVELQDIIEDGTVEYTKKNEYILDYLFKEQSILRGDVTKIMKGTPVGRFVEKMNSGGTARRLIKGVALGVAAGAVGALVGSGIGAAVAAPVAIGAARFVKGYTASERGQNGLSEVRPLFDKARTDTQMTGAATSGRDRFDVALRAADEYLEGEVKEQQKRRQRSLMMGAVAVGAGAGISYGVHSLMEAPSLSSLWGEAKASPGFPAGEVAATPSGVPVEAPISEGSGGDEAAGITERPHSKIDWTDHKGALKISDGEGWYQTFSELDIPEDKWGALLKEAGPQLVKEGVAYKDSSLGGYGMNMLQEGPNGTGKMPSRALEIIMDTYNDSGHAPGGTSGDVLSHTSPSGSLDSVSPEVPAVADAGDYGSSAAQEVAADRATVSAADFNEGADRWISEHQNVSVIKAGDEWRDILSRMNITDKSEQLKIMKLAGPDLVSSGAAYFDGRSIDSGYGLNYGNGKLSDGTIKAILAGYGQIHGVRIR